MGAWRGQGSRNATASGGKRRSRFSGDGPKGRRLKMGGAALSLTPEWRVHNGTSERDRPRRPGAVPISGAQPAMQHIIAHGRGNFAPPVRQRREGRDPDGRRPLAGSVSKASSTGRRRRLARIVSRQLIISMNRSKPTDSNMSLDAESALPDSPDHDYPILPALRRTHRRQEKHGPLLCHVDRTQPVRRSLSHPAMGPDRYCRPKAGASFRARGRGGQAIPSGSAKETVARIQAETACPAS